MNQTTQPKPTQKEWKENRFLAVLSYVSVLCFIPLLFYKQSSYLQFHAKQGLALFIIEVAAAILSWTVILAIPAAIISLVCLVLSIYGISLAWTGKTTPIPVISQLVQKLNI